MYGRRTILFIDEIHTIVGAGSAEGAIDAANIMKPELSRGDIQLIGATTLAEYRKFIEKDAALERRFQPVLVEEPTVDATIDILFGLKKKFESHHKIIIDDKAIKAAARLSERYIHDRFLPDKAIDVIDEACAMATVVSSFDSDKTKNLKERLRQTSFDKRRAINDRDFELATNLGELEKLYTSELTEELSRETNVEKAVVTEKEIIEVINEITGIDISNGMLNVAKRKFGQLNNLNFKLLDVESEFIEEKFDKIVLYSMFPHLNNKVETIKKLVHNSLNKNGKLLIAHSDSREFLNNLHSNADDRVNNDMLIDVNEQKEIFERESLKVIKAYEDDEIYYLVIENI